MADGVHQSRYLRNRLAFFDEILWTAAILKNRKNIHIKFGTVMHLGPPNLISHIYFVIPLY